MRQIIRARNRPQQPIKKKKETTESSAATETPKAEAAKTSSEE